VSPDSKVAMLIKQAASQKTEAVPPPADPKKK